jgi:hypothetical protein
MKQMKSITITLVSLFFSMSLFAGVPVENTSIKIDTNTKRVDLSKISEKVKAEEVSLPVEQLSKDFDSLLSENGEVDRETIEFEDDILATDEIIE